MISHSDDLNSEFKEFNRNECQETIFTISKREIVEANMTSSITGESLFTVFKDKQLVRKPSEKFQFTQNFFIDSKTKKYCYIYDYILE